MLVTLNEVLKDAQKKNYAIGLFNTVNLEMAKAVIEAAEEKRSPIIIGSAEILLSHCSIEELSAMLLPMIHKAKIPIVLHYDHGLTAELIVKALRWGFSSVMYDCSRDSYSENIRKCAEMVKIAKSFGAMVEGELGHVGSGNAGSIEGGNQDTSIYTDPQQAAEFVTKTGVDALAVAIGTAHGPYLTKPKLDIARLCEISEKVEIPLVLHGGSGLSDDDFRNCIKSGICKINIFTDIDRAGLEAVKKASSEGSKYLTDILPFMMKGVKEATLKKIELFGSSGKA